MTEPISSIIDKLNETQLSWNLRELYCRWISTLNLKWLDDWADFKYNWQIKRGSFELKFDGIILQININFKPQVTTWLSDFKYNWQIKRDSSELQFDGIIILQMNINYKISSGLMTELISNIIDKLNETQLCWNLMELYCRWISTLKSQVTRWLSRFQV